MNYKSSMTHSKWLIGYGVFLFICGLTGYLYNPEKAISSLIMGSSFGGLSVLWGFLLGKGMGFAKWAALTTTILLCSVFSMRGYIEPVPINQDPPH